MVCSDTTGGERVRENITILKVRGTYPSILCVAVEMKLTFKILYKEESIVLDGITVIK